MIIMLTALLNCAEQKYARTKMVHNKNMLEILTRSNVRACLLVKKNLTCKG